MDSSILLESSSRAYSWWHYSRLSVFWSNFKTGRLRVGNQWKKSLWCFLSPSCAIPVAESRESAAGWGLHQYPCSSRWMLKRSALSSRCPQSSPAGTQITASAGLRVTALRLLPLRQTSHWGMASSESLLPLSKPQVQQPRKIFSYMNCSKHFIRFSPRVKDIRQIPNYIRKIPKWSQTATKFNWDITRSHQHLGVSLGSRDAAGNSITGNSPFTYRWRSWVASHNYMNETPFPLWMRYLNCQ